MISCPIPGWYPAPSSPVRHGSAISPRAKRLIPTLTKSVDTTIVRVYTGSISCSQREARGGGAPRASIFRRQTAASAGAASCRGTRGSGRRLRGIRAQPLIKRSAAGQTVAQVWVRGGGAPGAGNSRRQLPAFERANCAFTCRTTSASSSAVVGAAGGRAAAAAAASPACSGGVPCDAPASTPPPAAEAAEEAGAAAPPPPHPPATMAAPRGQPPRDRQEAAALPPTPRATARTTA